MLPRLSHSPRHLSRYPLSATGAPRRLLPSPRLSFSLFSSSSPPYSSTSESNFLPPNQIHHPFNARENLDTIKENVGQEPSTNPTSHSFDNDEQKHRDASFQTTQDQENKNENENLEGDEQQPSAQEHSHSRHDDPYIPLDSSYTSSSSSTSTSSLLFSLPPIRLPIPGDLSLPTTSTTTSHTPLPSSSTSTSASTTFAAPGNLSTALSTGLMDMERGGMGNVYSQERWFRSERMAGELAVLGACLSVGGLEGLERARNLFTLIRTTYQTGFSLSAYPSFYRLEKLYSPKTSERREPIREMLIWFLEERAGIPVAGERGEKGKKDNKKDDGEKESEEEKGLSNWLSSLPASKRTRPPYPSSSRCSIKEGGLIDLEERDGKYGETMIFGEEKMVVGDSRAVRWDKEKKRRREVKEMVKERKEKGKVPKKKIGKKSESLSTMSEQDHSQHHHNPFSTLPIPLARRFLSLLYSPSSSSSTSSGSNHQKANILLNSLITLDLKQRLNYRRFNESFWIKRDNLSQNLLRKVKFEAFRRLGVGRIGGGEKKKEEETDGEVEEGGMETEVGDRNKRVIPGNQARRKWKELVDEVEATLGPLEEEKDKKGRPKKGNEKHQAQRKLARELRIEFDKIVDDWDLEKRDGIDWGYLKGFGIGISDSNKNDGDSTASTSTLTSIGSNGVDSTFDIKLWDEMRKNWIKNGVLEVRGSGFAELLREGLEEEEDDLEEGGTTTTKAGKGFDETISVTEGDGGGNNNNMREKAQERAMNNLALMGQAGVSTKVTLGEFIPLSIHHAFLRSHFRDALGAARGNDWNLASRLFGEAWKWWEMLEWECENFADRRGLNDQDRLGVWINRSTIGILVKGIVGMEMILKEKQVPDLVWRKMKVKPGYGGTVDGFKQLNFHQMLGKVLQSAKNVLDVSEQTQTPNHQNKTMTSHNPSSYLGEVLLDNIFRLSFPAYLGEVSSKQVLEFCKNGRGEISEIVDRDKEDVELGFGLKNAIEEAEVMLDQIAATESNMTTKSTTTMGGSGAGESGAGEGDDGEEGSGGSAHDPDLPLEVLDKDTKLPEVTMTIKGDTGEAPKGLVYLQQSLSTISPTRPSTTDSMIPSSEMDPFTRQRLLEEASQDAATALELEITREHEEIGVAKETRMRKERVRTMIKQWRDDLIETLKKDADEAKNWKNRNHKRRHAVISSSSTDVGGEGGGTEEQIPRWFQYHAIEPFLWLVPISKMALITIAEVLRYDQHDSGQQPWTGTAIAVGQAIENEHRVTILQGDSSLPSFEKKLRNFAFKNWALLSNGARQPDIEHINQPLSAFVRQRAINLMWQKDTENMTDAEMEESGWTPKWPPTIHSQIGTVLIHSLMDSATVERYKLDEATGEEHVEKQAAFSRSFQHDGGTVAAVLRSNPEVLARFDQDHMNIKVRPRYLPMLIRPRPWRSLNRGPYLTHETEVVRVNGQSEQSAYLRAANKLGNLKQLYEALDALSSTPWRINKKVLRVVLEAWNNGLDFPNVPALDPQSAYPDPVEPPDSQTSLASKIRHKQLLAHVRNLRQSAYSERCSLNYKLEIARAFADEVLYFPHNVDFRGRAYPIPPNLSHIGDDLSRGLLQFGQAKPLGEKGLRWLKIQLSATYGFDKASFDDRAAFADDRMDDVFKSADNPIEHGWWRDAEDPWQCLAVCFDLTEAIRSGRPTEHLSRLPIHLDGTCNGLQHYAALGGDEDGATQVNLLGSDKPADVYTGVASLVIKVVEEDAKRGVDEAQHLLGKITRKVVKQTVMTTVYGVTVIGAKYQILKQLRDRGDIPYEHTAGCARYLSGVVLTCIGSLFGGATAIQRWLTQCTKIVTKSFPNVREAAIKGVAKTPIRGSKGAKPKPKHLKIPPSMTSMAWSTPLGLPIVQPYRKSITNLIHTPIASQAVYDPHKLDVVDSRGQASAFPPNFVHSLDSTHMMMTALECRNRMTFASVHDSYWTHACDIEDLAAILRKQFVELHSASLLQHLQQELIDRFGDFEVPVQSLPLGALSPNIQEVDFEASPDTAINSSDLEGRQSSVESDEQGQPSSTKGKKSSKGTSKAKSSEAKEKDAGKTSARRTLSIVRVRDLLPSLPRRGNFDLQKVKDSPYFFS